MSYYEIPTNLDLIGVLHLFYDATFGLGPLLLLVLVPSVLIIFSAQEHERKNSLLISFLYMIISSILLLTQGLVKEYYVVIGILLMGFVAFAKMTNGGSR